MNEHLTHNDIEFYLLNREYSELKGDEKKFVDEHVSSEQEFNELKAIIQGINAEFMNEEELTPDPKIKANLLKEFDKHRPAGGYWLNGIFVSLFPKEKKLYQKPGFQIIGIAASVTLLIGIFLNNRDTLMKHEMAQHKTEKEIVAPAEEELAEKKVGEAVELEEEEGAFDDMTSTKTSGTGDELDNELMEIEEEKNFDNLAFAEPKKNRDVMQGETDKILQDEEVYYKSTTTVTQKDEVAEKEEDYRAVSETAGYADNNETDDLIISGNMPATTSEVSSAIDTDETLMEAVNNTSVNAATGGSAPGEQFKTDLPVNSRTLAEDSELIGLLYTAM